MRSHFWQGRWPVIWAFVAVAVVFAAGRLASGTVYGAWRFLGMPSMSPTFADLRTITHSIDAWRKASTPLPQAHAILGDDFIIIRRSGSSSAIGISSASSNIIGVLFHRATLRHAASDL